MMEWTIEDSEISEVERILLDGGHFQEDAKEVIRCWKSAEVSACPGSGKTTVLLAKLKLIADRMPLENGAGICVLSHTNVAVDEIKEKLSDYSSMLMGYPNFIGTIQSFIDQYVTFPYLRNLIKEPLQVMDQNSYAGLVWREICTTRGKYGKLFGLAKRTVEASRGKYSSEKDFLSRIVVKDDGIYNRDDEKRIAKNDADSAAQYRKLQMILLQRGYLTYEDSFKYAEKAINFQSVLKDLFNLRFRYVFIDEYQDCSDIQRKAIDLLFDKKKSTVIIIGDPDQAIYENSSVSKDWKPSKKALVIESSNRYSQEIADILQPLRGDGHPIKSTIGYVGIKPHILVYDVENISDVASTYGATLKKHGLKSGDYRAIGRIKNGKGTRLSSYWSGYNGNLEQQSRRYYALIDSITECLQGGRLYDAEKMARQLLCQVFGLLNVRSDDGKKLTVTSIKKILDEEYFDPYRDMLLGMAGFKVYSRESVDKAFRDCINKLCEAEKKDDVISHLPDFYMEDYEEARSTLSGSASSGGGGINTAGNTLYIGGTEIHFNTIHKEKGRTHDATLYLETVRKRQSDILQILPYLKGDKDGDDYVRKCAYVGFSRPRKLLCVAMSRDTFKKCGNVFDDWEIVDCSESIDEGEDDVPSNDADKVSSEVETDSIDTKTVSTDSIITVSCVADLNPYYDRLQVEYGDPSLMSIYNGGCEYNPDIAFVFMNPTGRNLASRPGWIGIRSPWIGTKQIWGLFSRVGLLDEKIHDRIRAYKPDQWTPEFAEKVYEDITNHNIFITNFAKCTQSDAKKISDTVYREYLPLLEREMEIVNPRAIVLFGTQVSTLFLGEKIAMAESRKISYNKQINTKTFECYPVFYPVGNGMHNIDKSIEDIKWILDRVR